MFRFSPLPWRLALVLAVLSAFAGTAFADACSDDTSCGFNACRTPATSVPSALWGELQPAGPTIPADRDTTDFTGFQEYDARNPFWMAVDVEGSYLFTATHTGFEIWDAASNPASPIRLAQKDGRRGGFLQFPANPEFKFPVQDLDAPEGDSTALAVVGAATTGISIWDTSNKSNPRQVYQDYGEGKDGWAVYSATVGGRAYAFMASETRGLLRYDMTKAKTFTSGCTEQSPNTQCAGVYLGKVGDRANVAYVAGWGNYVALSSGVSPKGVEIWDVSSTFPSLVASGLSDEIVFGIAMWQQGTKVYLAARGAAGQQLNIYDMSCLTGGFCGSIGSPIASVSTPDPSNTRYFVTHSESGTTPFLYVGSDRSCNGTEKREWLFDMSSPFAPRDITPPSAFYNGVLTGYWNWYYRATPTGFNNVGLRKARFRGDYLYKAAFSIFDVHKRGSGAALPNFIWSPSEVYPGTSVSFVDQSSGSPTSWAWTFTGGTPASSNVRNPTGVVFNTEGPKTISLQVCNDKGCNSGSKTLQVSSPLAAVSSVTVSSSTVKVCNTITATANGVTGKPPLTIQWAIRDSGGGTVATCTSNPCSWTPGTGVTSGAYTASVTVSNAENPGGATASAGFQVINEPLAFPSGAPTNDSFTGSTVKFHVQTTGATEWAWDFDDDGNPTTINFGPYSSDPVTGPNPTHTYSFTGQKSVRVRIRNCSGATLDSSPLVIDVTGAALSASFQAQGCLFGVCSFNVNQSISFTDFSSGTPERWTYDWNNTGTSTSGCSFIGLGTTSPVSTHSWSAAGTYRPCLRVTRGSSTDVYVHAPINITSSTGTPTISLVGPSSGVPGQALTFSASASSCTASASGWQWNTDGGVGSSTSSTITITWNTIGTKNISVTNTACGSATGTRAVAISSSTGGTLVASFTYSPTTVSTGQTVTFNATSSQGAPTAFTWEWGDGTPSSEGLIVTHTFTQPGTYPVKLTVAKAGEGPGCAFGFCSAETTTQITVDPGYVGACVPDSDTLCLGSRRFQVRVDWKTPDGTTGTGKGVPITDDTGYFWFFDVKNVEAVVKALDGCGVNGHYWVFSAGLTDVETTMTVTDTETGEQNTYKNPQKTAYLPIQDTSAYVCGALKVPAGEALPVDFGDWLPINEGDPRPEGRRYVVHGQSTPQPEADCVPSNTAICLNQGRFKVEASWKTPDGQAGQGQAISLTEDTGYFWFFNSANVELILKVLNGCGINNRYWVFAGGLTNVEVSIRVSDTQSGSYRTYVNPQGKAFAPIQDTAGLPFCP